jgi:hypothetical protein
MPALGPRSIAPMCFFRLAVCVVDELVLPQPEVHGDKTQHQQQPQEAMQDAVP